MEPQDEHQVNPSIITVCINTIATQTQLFQKPILFKPQLFFENRFFHTQVLKNCFFLKSVWKQTVLKKTSSNKILIASPKDGWIEIQSTDLDDYFPELIEALIVEKTTVGWSLVPGLVGITVAAVGMHGSVSLLPLCKLDMCADLRCRQRWLLASWT